MSYIKQHTHSEYLVDKEYLEWLTSRVTAFSQDELLGQSKQNLSAVVEAADTMEELTKDLENYIKFLKFHQVTFDFKNEEPDGEVSLDPLFEFLDVIEHWTKSIIFDVEVLDDPVKVKKIQEECAKLFKSHPELFLGYSYSIGMGKHLRIKKLANLLEKTYYKDSRLSDDNLDSVISIIATIANSK